MVSIPCSRAWPHGFLDPVCVTRGVPTPSTGTTGTVSSGPPPAIVRTPLAARALAAISDSDRKVTYGKWVNFVNKNDTEFISPAPTDHNRPSPSLPDPAPPGFPKNSFTGTCFCCPKTGPSYGAFFAFFLERQ